MQDGCIDYVGLMAQQLDDWGEDYSLSLSGRPQEGNLNLQTKQDAYQTRLIAAACGIATIIFCFSYCNTKTKSDKQECLVE